MCIYCVKCTKFGKLFLRKVIKTVATRCLDFSSKLPKMRLAAGSARTRWGSLCAPPDPLAGKGGLLLRGGKGGRKGEEEYCSSFAPQMFYSRTATVYNRSKVKVTEWRLSGRRELCTLWSALPLVTSFLYIFLPFLGQKCI